MNYNNSYTCLTAKDKSLLFFFTLTHSNYVSQRRQYFALSSLFSSPRTALSWPSSFSRSGSLLTTISFVLCIFLFICFLFNMQHTRAFYIIKKSFSPLSLLFLAKYEFLTWLKLGIFWPTRSLNELSHGLDPQQSPLPAHYWRRFSIYLFSSKPWRSSRCKAEPSSVLWETSKVPLKEERNWFCLLFRTPLFLGKWCGVITYFLYKKIRKN